MKTPLESLASSLATGRYRHYKGREYEVLGVATHSETHEKLVVYKCLYGDFDIWVRPLTLFVETVNLGGVDVPRFEKIADHASSES